MDAYRILPHTADAKFEASGRTLEEAFGNAALALTSLMWDWAEIELARCFPVHVHGLDREQLLVKFLSEILYLLDTRCFLLGAVSGLVIREAGGGLDLEAEFRGDFQSNRYKIHGAAKAVTYSEMKIEEGEGFRIQVVVDV